MDAEKWICWVSQFMIIQYSRTGGNKMARKIRSDITVGNLEKKLGILPGSFRNPNGRDTRSDKKLGTMRKEAAKAAKTKK